MSPIVRDVIEEAGFTNEHGPNKIVAPVMQDFGNLKVGSANLQLVQPSTVPDSRNLIVGGQATQKPVYAGLSSQKTGETAAEFVHVPISTIYELENARSEIAHLQAKLQNINSSRRHVSSPQENDENSIGDLMTEDDGEPRKLALSRIVCRRGFRWAWILFFMISAGSVVVALTVVTASLPSSDTPPSANVPPSSTPLEENSVATPHPTSSSTTNISTNHPVDAGEPSTSTNSPTSLPTPRSLTSTPTVLLPPPTNPPTRMPTSGPTATPTRTPIRAPTVDAGEPSTSTDSPTSMPTSTPTVLLPAPTIPPTRKPTRGPTKSPTRNPTRPPTKAPTSFPTWTPTGSPTSLSDGSTVTFSTPPYPNYRFIAWSKMASSERVLVQNLGYNSTTWNNVQTEIIEQVSYEYAVRRDFANMNGDLSEQTTEELLIAIGFTEPMVWNCWVNHYRFFHWTQLGNLEWDGNSEYGPSVQAAWATFGWTESIWEAGSEPVSMSKSWNQLTASEQDAATFLCYTEDIWDKNNLEEWA